MVKLFFTRVNILICCIGEQDTDVSREIATMLHVDSKGVGVFKNNHCCVLG